MAEQVQAGAAGAGLDPNGFTYGMGAGWLPYLLGMEELPGKESFQRASVGTDLFKSLTDFMTNPTAGPLGLAATAAYGGPQGISAGTGGQGLPELGAYRSRFDTLLDNLMGFSGTMNAQPEDTKYNPPPIDPNKAPALTPESAAKAPNAGADMIRAWEAYNPGQKHPQRADFGLKYGGVVEMMLPAIEKKPKTGMASYEHGGEHPIASGMPPIPTGTPTPTRPGAIKGPFFEGEADPMAAFGGSDLVDAMKKYTADGGDANQFIKTVKAISQLANMVKEGKITPGQPMDRPVGAAYSGPIPGGDLMAMGPEIIKQMLSQYGSQVGLAQGGGVVVGGQPHFVVDANGHPVAAITEDGKPEAVTGTRDGFEVTPLDPARNAAYNAKKGNSMGSAIADAEDFMSRMTAIPHAATGASLMLPRTYVGDSQAHPSGEAVPTIGGPGQSREQQVGSYWKPQTGAGAPTLMEQMSRLPGDYNSQYARLFGGALSGSNMAVPAEQLQQFNAGRAPDKLLSAQALSTLTPTQRKGYAALLQQMGIIQSPEDLDYAVNQFRPAGLG